MGVRRWGWGGILSAMALFLGSHRDPSPGRAEGAPPRSATRRSSATDAGPPVGAGRCSAAACHGSAAPVFGSRVRQDEYTTWISSDPHANAYQVLFSGVSRSIAERLGKATGRTIPAHRDGRCLACHATPGTDPAPGASTILLRDGVGCEACHGSAAPWLAEHATYDWAGLPAQVKEDRFGMTWTKDLTRRAEACAGCHVGAPARGNLAARVVDHDLIAAGHPRLDFEFSGFLANLPAHWVEEGRNAAGDFPARAWAIGQAVSARAALELLRSRAGEAASGGPGRATPWPEFAEYDCASCHHDLGLPPLRGRGALPDRLVEAPAWGTWYYPLADVLARRSPGEAPARFHSRLGPLHDAMSAPSPAPETVADRAGGAAEALALWLRSLSSETFDPPKVAKLLRDVRSPGGNAEDRPGEAGLDGLSQRYLALIPLRQALVAQGHDDPGTFQEILGLRARLLNPSRQVRPSDIVSPRPGREARGPRGSGMASTTSRRRAAGRTTPRTLAGGSIEGE